MYGTAPTHRGIDDVRGRCSCACRAASQPGAISTRVAGAYRALRQSSPEDTRRTAALTFRNPIFAQPLGLGRRTANVGADRRDPSGGGAGPLGEPIQSQHRHMRLTSPGLLKLGSRGDDEQHRHASNSINRQRSKKSRRLPSKVSPSRSSRSMLCSEGAQRGYDPI